MRFASTVRALVLGTLACSAFAGASAPTPTSAIDDTFRRLERGLPPADTLSEQNGASTMCAHGGGSTYTHLRALGTKVPIANAADLPRLIKWARHSDLCIREIAIHALLPKIGYNENQLAIPWMHGPEHYEFHDILAASRAYFDAKHIAYDAKIFDGLLLAPNAHDFHAHFDGHWTEDSGGKGFQEFVELAGDEIRVTTKHIPVDPKWPDSTETTKIKGVAVDHGQYVVTGAWNVESNAAGYQGPRMVPAQFEYRFWQVSDDIAWFKNVNSPYWDKLRRS